MVTLLFDFDREEDMTDAAARLWDEPSVSGEVLCHALDNGRWRMEVIAERPVPAALLEGLKEHRVEP